MLNHAGNSYITRRKQLCHPPDTVMSHRTKLYHPLVYLFCILIRSSSKNVTYNVTYIKCLLGRLYQNISPSMTRNLSPGVLCHPLPSASGDITRQGFRVTSGLIFWYVLTGNSFFVFWGTVKIAILTPERQIRNSFTEG